MLKRRVEENYRGLSLHAGNPFYYASQITLILSHSITWKSHYYDPLSCDLLGWSLTPLLYSNLLLCHTLPALIIFPCYHLAIFLSNYIVLLLFFSLHIILSY